MDFPWKIIQKYLQHTATIYLHSSPNFVLETFLTIVIFLIYIYQHVEVSRISRRMLRLRPHTILCRANTGSNHSKESVSTTVTHYQKKIFTVNPSTTVAYKRIPTRQESSNSVGWVYHSTRLDNTVTSIPQTPDRRGYGEQLIALTPEQFVKIDKERKLRDKELDSCMASLSTLCKNVMKRKYSAKTLNRQVEMVREGLECNKMSLEGNYLGFKTEAMTQSLFCLLERLITTSSLKNPLPFKGDITALALDAAQLSRNTHVKNNWDVQTSSSISDITEIEEDTETITTFKDGEWHKEGGIKIDCLMEKF